MTAENWFRDPEEKEVCGRQVRDLPRIGVAEPVLIRARVWRSSYVQSSKLLQRIPAVLAAENLLDRNCLRLVLV